MAKTRNTEIELRNKRVEREIEDVVRRMGQRTGDMVGQLRMTRPARQAVERAYRKVICARMPWLLPRHTTAQRRYLRMMLELAVATDQSLQKRAIEVARCLSRNYIFEWCASTVTGPAQATSRDLILRGADSAFGDTPSAPQLAYVMFHHNKMGIRNVSDYTELYSRLLALDKGLFFNNKHNDWRLRLGLQRHAQMRRDALGSE